MVNYGTYLSFEQFSCGTYPQLFIPKCSFRNILRCHEVASKLITKYQLVSRK